MMTTQSDNDQNTGANNADYSATTAPKYRSCFRGYDYLIGDKAKSREHRKFKRHFRAVCAVARGGASVGLAVVGASLQSVWAA